MCFKLTKGNEIIDTEVQWMHSSEKEVKLNVCPVLIGIVVHITELLHCCRYEPYIPKRPKVFSMSMVADQLEVEGPQSD